MVDRRFRTSALAVTMLALVGCQCGPELSGPDGGDVDGGSVSKPDGSVVVLPPDPRPNNWPETFASEPCPVEAFGARDAPDGGDAGLHLGICIALRTLTADALLDGVPETKPVTVQFIAGKDATQEELEAFMDLSTEG